MTSAENRMTADELRLHAYHDGELGPLARWRFERRLTRSPGLRRELAALGRLGEWARKLDREAGPSPNLWDAIALRLPAEDARRAESASRAPSEAVFSWWVRPFAAAAATAAVALAIGLLSRDTAPVGVVRWIDSGSRSVMVLEGDADTTIIWVLDDGAPGDLSKGDMRDVV